MSQNFAYLMFKGALNFWKVFKKLGEKRVKFLTFLLRIGKIQILVLIS